MKEKAVKIYNLFCNNTQAIVYVILVLTLGIYTISAGRRFFITLLFMGIFTGLMLTAKFYSKNKLYRYLFAFIAFILYILVVQINSLPYVFNIVVNKWTLLLFCYVMLLEDYISPIIVGIYPAIRILMLIPEAREGKYPLGQITGTANGQICLTIMSVLAYNLFAKLLIERNKFRKMSITDSLTGVATFAHTIEVANKMLQNGNISVLITDMDRFKQVNDTYGHIAGNRVLVEIAELIKQETEGLERVIGRLGGDEFVIAVRNDGSKRVLELGENILGAVKKRMFTIDPEIDPMKLSLSIGQANSSLVHNNVEKLLRKADVNMYYNKYKNHRLNIFINKEKLKLPKEGYELLNVLAEKDMYTYVHSSYTAQYASALAKELKLPEEKAGQLYVAGWLHDIGKILVSSDIVRKVGKLSDDEYDLMKNHVCFGVNILKSLGLSETVVNCIKYHHERCNGSGYPNRLSGNQVPIEARILQVADSFSAMIIKRVYRKTLMPEDALEEIIKNSGTQFDPEIVSAFGNMLKRKVEIA
ncbi:MAG: diguanylate cyclase [Bacillota bacterium]|nr:diguanylate cyclase [Bacillota bacterium]